MQLSGASKPRVRRAIDFRKSAKISGLPRAAAILSSSSRIFSERPALGHQLGGEADRAVLQVAIDYFVDQADRERLSAVDRLTAGDHLKRLLDADQPRQTLGTAGAGQQAELDLGQAEARRGDADPEMAGQRDLQAAAECRAVDRRDHRLGAILDPVQHSMQPGLARRLAELGDVGAGDEGPAGAMDHDRPDRRIGLRRRDAVRQALAHALAQRVDRRVVDDQDGDRAGCFEIDLVGDGSHLAVLLIRY